MSEISCSVQIVKQAKKKLLTIQSVRMLTWQGSYDDVAVSYTDMAGLSWRTVGS
jgi:hypothetical protein